MRIIRHPRKKSLKGCVVALGTFDGVHRGHQKVLQCATRQAHAIDAAALAITFDPHPQSVVAPEKGIKILTTLQEREELLAHYGMDGVIVFRFNHHLQKMTARAFVEKYLVGRLGVRGVVVGFDYAFGCQRTGSIHELVELGKRYGFTVTIVPRVEKIKSRVIREMLHQGKFNPAVKLLDHAYPITGSVVKGFGRGRELGFPTANLHVDSRKLVPAEGVYAGRWGNRPCAVNIGRRPTFGVGEKVVEVHVLRFNGNLRGKKLKIDVIRKIRPERRFSNISRLKEQIVKDLAVCEL